MPLVYLNYLLIFLKKIKLWQALKTGVQESVIWFVLNLIMDVLDFSVIFDTSILSFDKNTKYNILIWFILF